MKDIIKGSDNLSEKLLEKIINIIGEDNVFNIKTKLEGLEELLLGNNGLEIYLPYDNETELKESEKTIENYLNNNLEFNYDFEEQDFIDKCRRIYLSYEEDELNQLKFVLKLLKRV